MSLKTHTHTINFVNPISRVESIVRGLARGQVRDVRGLGDRPGVARVGREEKFEFVEMGVSEKLSDDCVSESVNESVVFARPAI